MRPPSAWLISTLTSLHRRVESGTQEQIAESMAELANIEHPAVALGLAPLTITPYPHVAAWAAKKIGDVLCHLNEDGLLWLAREGRHADFTGSRWQFLWETLRENDLHKFDALGDEFIGPLCIASVHANGYLRQACVEKLAHYGGSLAMGFLFLRINDWVTPVRTAARQELLRRLEEARAGNLARCRELLHNLLLSDHLENWGRDDHRSVREAIDMTLMSPAFAQVLEDGLTEGRPVLVGRVYRLALEHFEDAPGPLLFRALASKNGTIRFWAAREGVQRLAGDDLHRFVHLMLSDSLAIVRHEAVFALATKISPTDPSILIDFLVDPGPDVRFLAGHYLEKIKFDARAHYLRLLANPNPQHLAAIVGGIGEKGKSGDELGVVPLLTHPDPAVRAAAVRTVGKLQRGGDLEWVFAALRDQHKWVVREAARQLEERMHIVDPSVIATWYAHEPRSSLRRQALRLGAKMEHWAALAFLLDAAQTPDPTVRHDVNRELTRWSVEFIDWYTPPNPSMLARLVQGLEAARGIIDEDRQYWIGRRLAVYRK